jgi:hypothetical protein
MENSNYVKFLGMLTTSFVIMYVIMFLNVNGLEHISEFNAFLNDHPDGMSNGDYHVGFHARDVS